MLKVHIGIASIRQFQCFPIAYTTEIKKIAIIMFVVIILYYTDWDAGVNYRRSIAVCSNVIPSILRKVLLPQRNK